MVENKIDAAFQPEQAKRYTQRGEQHRSNGYAEFRTVLIAPAMNTTMWENPAMRRNVARLRKDGVHFIEPVAGE